MIPRSSNSTDVSNLILRKQLAKELDMYFMMQSKTVSNYTAIFEVLSYL